MKLLTKTLEATVIARPVPTTENPQHLCLDKGYDYADCQVEAINNGYIPHIRSRGEEQAEKEKHPDKKARRWVVEVCHSWLNRFRKILVRFEKKRTHHLGLLAIACAYIVFKRAEIF